MFRQIGGALGVAAFVAILGTPSADSVLGRFDDTRWFMAAAAIIASAALLLVKRPTLAAVPAPGAPEGGQDAPSDAVAASPIPSNAG
jgi:hypothetical protein